ncbi:hypothetical protein [Saccharopolyspora hattusasensis]|uniref:hypothetical protein n=1 Tax=Saccharopolyspora hattusasensis TaxID=1128679 RepID=UPI003D99546A
MKSERAAHFYLPPEAKQDIERLHALAQRTPKGSESRHLAVVAMNTILEIKNGTRSTHPLEYLPSYPDLSDCETTYVGADPNKKPSHRVVWRETPPETPGDAPLREVIAIGERKNGAVYHIAGQRLGRPTGVTLAELRVQPEPMVDPSRSRQRSSDFSASPESDLEYD